MIAGAISYTEDCDDVPSCYRPTLYLDAYSERCKNGLVQSYSARVLNRSGAPVHDTDSAGEFFSIDVGELDSRQEYRVCVRAHTADSVRSQITYASPETCVTLPPLALCKLQPVVSL